MNLSPAIILPTGTIANRPGPKSPLTVGGGRCMDDGLTSIGIANGIRT